MGLTPRGYVRATASAINQGELDALGEKINFLEKQLKVSVTDSESKQQVTLEGVNN
jgi:hypothetical protein